MKVLIAEDDLDLSDFLKEVLESWNFNVVVTNDGSSALKILKNNNPPQVALLDWEMPGKNGIDVCRIIKEKEKTALIYTIILTARNTKEDIVKGLQAGADDYVIKPFDMSELHARLNVAKRVVKIQENFANKVVELEEALYHVKMLQGILPICMHCHKIRNDQEAWLKMERYIEAHSDVQFSHSICPDCMEEYYPEEEDK